MEFNGVTLWGSMYECMSVHMSVCLSMTKYTGNKQLGQEAFNFAKTCMHHDWWQDNFACQFSSESSLSLTFISKVKDSNWVHWELRTWLSCKRWQIGQTLPWPTHIKSEVAFQLEYLHLTLANTKGKVKDMHISTEKSHKWWQMANISIVLKYDVTCGLSIRLFRVDLSLF